MTVRFDSVFRSPEHAPTRSYRDKVVTLLDQNFSINVVAIIKDYFYKFIYQYDSDDFGIQIDRLRVSPIGGYREIMLFLAKKLGFDVDLANGEYYPRDSLMRVEWAKSMHGKTLLLPVNDYAFYYANRVSGALRALKATWNTIGSGSSVETRYYEPALDDYEAMYGELMKANIYFDGGNCFVVTDPRDSTRKVCLVGAVTFLTSLLVFRDQGKFDEVDGNIQRHKAVLQRTMTDCDVRMRAVEMARLGLFGHQYFKRNAPKYVIAAGDEPRIREKVVTYEAQKRHIKEEFAGYLVAGEKYTFESTIVVPQVHFHLDMFMRPGPNGAILLHSFAICRDVLIYIKENADRFGLTELDRKLLEQYLKAATKRAVKYERVFAHLKNKTLRDFSVIPTPAVFSCPKQTRVSFINGVSGWSNVTKRYYYILIGVKIGDKLGDALMIMFQEFLEAHIKDIDVFYFGKSSSKDDPNHFDYYNASKKSSIDYAGLHCLTKETAATSHDPVSV